jgi:hypothetical protein
MRGDDRQESEMFLYGSREESLNMTLRKALKTRGAFPSERAALKVQSFQMRLEFSSLEKCARLAKIGTIHGQAERAEYGRDVARCGR